MASQTDGKCPDCGGPVVYGRFDWETGEDLFRCEASACSGNPFAVFTLDELDFSPTADEWTPQLDCGAIVQYREGLQTLVGTVDESHEDGTVTLMGSVLKNEPDFDIAMSAIERLVPWDEYVEAM